MKVIMVMFDSLNRSLLSPYGCKDIHTPNFKRLAERCTTFDQSYVGSLPCMPARRELHTGRYDFLHRSWGPIEPFDDSMPELLKRCGIKSHLISDHYHYWEDGGATYHTRYSSWEAFRGQEGDPWKCLADQDDSWILPNRNGRGSWGRQDWVNRRFMKKEEDFSQSQVFKAASDFLHQNNQSDNWFLHIEAFDPHEPFYAPDRFRELYADDYKGEAFDWPFYGKVQEDQETIRHLRREYAALLTMCDESLGKVLDLFDRYNLWSDTLLIVNTDHGFLLGEHGYLGKCAMPFYNEVAHTPLFIWNPKASVRGDRCDLLVQTIDLPATVLDWFGINKPTAMQGHSLLNIHNQQALRNAALFGIHGGQVGCTDGHYLYLRSPVSPDNKPLYEYTLMPTRHGLGRAFIPEQELAKATLAPPFGFSKECPLLAIPAKAETPQYTFPTTLYDLANDPLQLSPIDDQKTEERMIELMISLMKDNDSPAEQFERLGLYTGQ